MSVPGAIDLLKARAQELIAQADRLVAEATALRASADSILAIADGFAPLDALATEIAQEAQQLSNEL